MRSAVWTSRTVCGLILLFWSTGAATAAEAQHPAAAGAKDPYPNMAAITEYRIASQSEEIDMARSAAPPSISGDATVLTLGSHGYETEVPGKNGFACMVMRSWAADFPDTQFWNPKLRGPICLNPAAVRSELPGYLERTQWVLAGVSKADMIARTKAALAAKTPPPPAPGAMSYMMSRRQYLSDTGGHWHPHLMFYLPRTEDAATGANLDGSPVISDQSSIGSVTVLIVPITHWSDGTAAVAEKH